MEAGSRNSADPERFRRWLELMEKKIGAYTTKGKANPSTIKVVHLKY